MPRPRLILRHFWALMTVASLVDTARARRRLAAIPVLRPGDAEPTKPWKLVTAPGVVVAPAARAAAEAYAEEQQLDVLDLVPPDLDAGRMLALVRAVDPDTYRDDRLAPGRGAGCAMLLSPAVVDRLGPQDRDLPALLLEAKRCAPTTTDLAIVPGIHAGEGTAPPDAPIQAGLLGAGLAVSRFWGAAALAAHLLPRLVVAPRAPGRPQPEAKGEWFESRRDSCPWCGSSDLRSVVTCRDEMQHKPGVFHIEGCRGCGHLFQNPRLSVEGLDFYYRDFYGGDSAERFDELFGLSPDHYRERAASLASRYDEPEPPATWLDVGAGRGHFCLVAQEQFPKTRFEALDMDDGVAEAERRGWVSRAHRGAFPDLAAELEGQFDVVSLYHCLEHTREPRDELAAAARVLRDGGYLAVEVPDPECATRHVFGRWWFPWFQPQHQHFVPVGNLCEALADLGFEIVDVERQQVHQPVEVAMGSWLALGHFGPPSDKPWHDPPTPARRLRHSLAATVGVPVVLAGFLVDRLLGPVISRVPRGSNTYRVTARRRRAPAERERVAVEHCRAHGYPASLGPPPSPDAELEGRDRIQEAIRLHVALHQVPVDGLAGHLPRADPAELLARFDRGRFGEEWAWLDGHAPSRSTAAPVLCHGSFQPMVLVDAGDEETAVVGWHRAVLGDAELDVAYTLLAFWSGHFFADTRPEATMLRMIREPLAATYRRSYSQTLPLDPGRLRFWLAFLALRDVALAAGAYATDGDPLGGDDAATRPAGLTTALRRHFWRLARSE